MEYSNVSEVDEGMTTNEEDVAAEEVIGEEFESADRSVLT